MKLWAGIILFLGLGVSLGLVVALAIVGGGGSTRRAIAVGSFAGAVGAWLVPYLAMTVSKRFRGPRRPA
jgi:hypothetical protein